MHIKEIELTNFQKHSNFKANFTDGVNVIYGATDTGKSCIVRAIKWIFFGEPKGDVVRKEGTKKTSVKVTLENNIVVEKIKSNTVNAYILKVGDEEKRFDAVGKKIPEEIKKILKVRTIDIDNESIILNIADQIALPFLLDKSGISRMKFFNKLTGNNIIDKVMQSLNKDILQIGREEKIEIEHQKEREKSLKEVSEKRDKIEKVYKEFLEIYNRLKEKSERHEKLSNLATELQNNKSETKLNREKLGKIKTIDENKLLDLEVSIERLEKLNEFLYNIKRIKKDLLEVEEKLKTIKIPEIDINKLRVNIERLTNLRKMITQLNDIKIANENFTKKIDTIVKEIKKDTEKYKKLLQESGICPTCKTKMDENKIKEIKL